MTDMNTKQMLEDWGLSDYIEIFEKHEIDVDAMLELNEEIVKELIPKIGPRLKFLKNLRLYKDIKDIPVITEEDISETLSSSIASSATEEHEADLDIVTVKCNTENVEAIHLGSKENDNLGKISEAFLASSSPVGFTAFYGDNELSTCLRKSFNLNLYKFLNGTNSGKYVLSTYKRENKLTSKARNMLVDILINGLMTECNGRLLPIDFQNLANKISSLFPTEDPQVYYIPRVRKQESMKLKPINAKGKLVDKYRNLNRLFKAEKVAEETEVHKQKSSSTITGEMEESAKWLKHFMEPWDAVIKHWNTSFALRRNTSVTTVTKFLEEWPILKHQKAISLIQIDFECMFPDSNMNLYVKWESFFEKLLSIKPVHDTTTDELLSILSINDLNEDSRIAIQIMLLSNLIPPKGRIRNNSLHWKPTVVECQKSIICHVKIPGDIQNSILTKIKEQHFTNHVQPYIMVVGSTLSNITESYLVIDTSVYKGTSVLQCLDICFKAFHVLSAEYPAESEHIWLLLQHHIYKITTQWDKKIPYVYTLLSELSHNNKN
ncbi:uncharacterized protein LOC112904301 isoform X1 [Agrilus planipennis]|uniref:Uncharacterized protein LOC112904301 isoform X1 n=1 Tax=Agrilus planipennis TaxID=224129 RepID=A0A7F5R3H1_AGRPL|nr:uncharacterized protein LOC112904301 isoform X1 [Agrilus planipennis]